MESGLVVKDVEFNGTWLKAVQDVQKVIWVGIRWVCDGIGMTEDQRKRQIKNIQNDIVLNKGGSNLTLPTNGGRQNAWCIQLDFLPLWLAKISITPKMKKETPELVEKLVVYQIKAKDALAAAFLPQYKTEDSTAQIREIKEYFTYRMDKLNADLAKICEVMMRSQGITSLDTGASLIETDNRLPVQKSYNKDYFAWKQNVYNLADEIMRNDYRYSQNRSVLSSAYFRMRDVYGFVQSQAEKEYMYRHGIEEKPHTIDVIYDDKTYRTTLVPILQTMLEEAKGMNSSQRMTNIIAPLVKKRKDRSPYNCVVYRAVFAEMERQGLVCWKNRITRYQNTHCTKQTPNKKAIIAENAMLMRKFEKTVKELVHR